MICDPLLAHCAPKCLFSCLSPTRSNLLHQSCQQSMLRLNPTQLRLEARDFKWHVDRLNARRAQRDDMDSKTVGDQGRPLGYKHADIVEPSSLPFQALPIARTVSSPPISPPQGSQDWCAVWEQLNRGYGFSPKVQSVKSGSPVVVTTDPEHSKTRPKIGALERNSGIVVDRRHSHRSAELMNSDSDAESTPAPIDHMLRKVSRQVSERNYGLSPKDADEMYENFSPRSHIDVDGPRDETASLPRRTALAHRSKSTSTGSGLDPAAAPFIPGQELIPDAVRSEPSPQTLLSRDQRASVHVTGGDLRLSAPLHWQIDVLRRRSGTLVPSPLHISHVAASSSPSRQSGSAANEAASAPAPSRLLSRPPRRLPGPGSSPFATADSISSTFTVEPIYDLDSASNFLGSPDRETRSSPEQTNSRISSTALANHQPPPRSGHFSNSSSSSSSPFTQNPSQTLSDPPPLPRYSFHRTPRNVSNMATMPTYPRSPSPSVAAHSYTPSSSDHASSVATPSPPRRQQAPPPPNTPTTGPRSSTFRIYNDRLPATSQPQTPVGLPRHGIPAELARSNLPTVTASATAAYTAPEGRRIGTERRNRSGAILSHGRLDQSIEVGGTRWDGRDGRARDSREFGSPTRVRNRNRVEGARARMDGWVEGEGRENWER